MAQYIYILSDTNTHLIAESISDQIFVNGIVESENIKLTTDILIQIAKSCPVEYFYIIATDQEIIFPKFDFSFKPEEWDKEYVHIWNNDTRIRVFNKAEVLKNPTNFTDESLKNGNIKLKNIDKKIYEYPQFDIIFLSYDETDADNHFRQLRNRFPRAKRISGVKGIFEAHKAAAKLSDTSMFYVVDADAEISPTFTFDYQPTSYDRHSVHIWYSKNPVNGLEYGYGGVKLFPRKILLEYKGSSVDFTTSVSGSVKVIPEVSNITRFNTDPFSTWRSAFRECVKLSSKIITGQTDNETEERLRIWQTNGDGEFGDFAIMGANEGREFGKENINQPEQLKLINDFNWLEKRFNS